jgi:hypothetical protein
MTQRSVYCAPDEDRAKGKDVGGDEGEDPGTQGQGGGNARAGAETRGQGRKHDGSAFEVAKNPEGVRVSSLMCVYPFFPNKS